MEFNSRKLTFKLDGVEYSLLYPNVGQIEKWQDMEEREDKVTALVEFFHDLGLDKKVTRSLEQEHISSIVKELVGDPNTKK